MTATQTPHEAFMRTLKGKLVWLRERSSPKLFFAALDRWLGSLATPRLSAARLPNHVLANRVVVPPITGPALRPKASNPGAGA